MSKIIKEFHVDSVIHLEDEYCVRGTCYKGLIEIGDTFLVSHQYRIKESVSGLRHEFEKLGRTDIRDVKLQVIRIKAFNRDLDELDQGVSGELCLKGEGGHLLRKEDYLVLS